MYKSLLWKIILLTILAITSLYYAFYNQYPLVTEDSGFYISFGFAGFGAGIPPFRPMPYCLLVRHISLSESLWFVVLFQASVISYLIYHIIRISGLPHLHLVSSIIIFLLSIFSSYSFYVSQIMADIWTAAGFLAFVILLLDKELKLSRKVILSCILITAFLTHLSNAYVIMLTFLLFIGIYFFVKPIKNYISFRRIKILGALLFVSLFSLQIFNYLAYKEFTASKTSHIFLMARMVESGILHNFLIENCSTHKYALCDYVDQLPNNATGFIFDQHGVVAKTDGLMDSTGEYRVILKKILTTPRYVFVYGYKTFFSMLKLLVSHEVGEEVYKMGPDNYPSWTIKQSYAKEYNEYMLSKQNNGKINYSFINTGLGIFLLLSILFLIYYFSITGIIYISEFQICISILIVTVIVVNAFVCAAGAGSFARYSSKLIWLVNFLACINLAFYMLKQKSKGFNTSIKQSLY